jgi:hypothetical protein
MIDALEPYWAIGVLHGEYREPKFAGIAGLNIDRGLIYPGLATFILVVDFPPMFRGGISDAISP